jgi:hypothetical protein
VARSRKTICYRKSGSSDASHAGATTCPGDDQTVTEEKARPASKPFLGVVVLARPEGGARVGADTDCAGLGQVKDASCA